MKNVLKVLAIIALAVIIGFSFAACDDDEDDDGNKDGNTDGITDGDDDDDGDTDGDGDGGVPIGTFPATIGSLTINGLSGYVGKYVLAAGVIDSEEIYLYALAGGNMETKQYNLAKISSGSVMLKVWKVNDNDQFVSYSGSDIVTLMIVVLNKETLTEDDMGDNMRELDPSSYQSIGYNEDVQFTNGRATVTFTSTW